MIWDERYGKSAVGLAVALTMHSEKHCLAVALSKGDTPLYYSDKAGLLTLK